MTLRTMHGDLVLANGNVTRIMEVPGNEPHPIDEKIRRLKDELKALREMRDRLKNRLIDSMEHLRHAKRMSKNSGDSFVGYLVLEENENVITEAESQIAKEKESEAK